MCQKQAEEVICNARDKNKSDKIDVAKCIDAVIYPQLQ